MSGLKSVIITLPAKPKQPTQQGALAVEQLAKQAPKLNFTTSILVDKIKMEAAAAKKPQAVKHMELGLPEAVVFKQEAAAALPSRGKKRRLDHLTWEEKLQRKKLKNRVAAQTSRDRKKAKLDELEETVRALRERNEMLVEECSMLRTQNESLILETKRLKTDKELMESKESKEQVCSMCQARVGCTVPALGSAAGWNSTNGTTSDTDAKCYHTSEDPDSLPPLEDLFSELQGDDYIERLEELAESLLREVTAEVETNSAQPNEQNPVKAEDDEEFDNPEKVVGEASSYVEADAACRSITAAQSRQSREALTPAAALSSPRGPPALAEKVEIKEEPMHDADTVYGTYDEATNCITIIYPEEELPLGHYQQHRPARDSPSYESLSPTSLHSDDVEMTSAGKLLDHCGVHSDGGYESHGSPASSTSGGAAASLTDLWHESFSELFPSLA